MLEFYFKLKTTILLFNKMGFHLNNCEFPIEKYPKIGILQVGLDYHTHFTVLHRIFIYGALFYLTHAHREKVPNL